MTKQIRLLPPKISLFLMSLKQKNLTFQQKSQTKHIIYQNKLIEFTFKM